MRPLSIFNTGPLTMAENAPTILWLEISMLRSGHRTILTYSLVNGAGDGNNSLFALETNGTLKTATTFDYEADASTYSIRVQVRDEFNASIEGPHPPWRMLTRPRSIFTIPDL